MNLKELYQEIILEHGKNPRNLGKTDDFNKDAKGHNPLCGDNVHVFLKLNGQKRIEIYWYHNGIKCYNLSYYGTEILMNSDENPEMMKTFGLMGVPSMILYKDGQPVEKTSGYRPKVQLESWLKKFK